MTTLRHLYRQAVDRLRSAGVESAESDARLLIRSALDLRRDALILNPDAPLSPAQNNQATAAIERRAAREPVSRILGKREFWSLDFRLCPATLDPRPDSETLVEASLSLFPDADAPLSILDLGTGSGCLLLAVLSERPRAFGIGIDASAEAIAVANDNAATLKLSNRATFMVGDWRNGLSPPLAPDQRFDMILSNPPYIPLEDISTLQPEVSLYDPHLALNGGPDGLDAYRSLAPQIAERLSHCGVALFEIGAGQALDVVAIAAAAGLHPFDVRRDLANHERCVLVRRPSFAPP
ncbi:Release factor glutamine methyltransferase [Azospirillaceae bacterium]